MATEIKVPRVGMAVAEATIIEWTIKEGDWVEERQVVGHSMQPITGEKSYKVWHIATKALGSFDGAT